MHGGARTSRHSLSGPPGVEPLEVVRRSKSRVRHPTLTRHHVTPAPPLAQACMALAGRAGRGSHRVFYLD